MAENEATIVIKAKDEATSTLKNIISNGISALMSPIGLAVGAMAALTAGFKIATDEAIEAQQNLAQLQAVLKSTGSAAGVTEKQALDLATALSETTVYSDDAVLSAENLLLTFTKIGKDIFPEATKITADLATALKMDLNSAAMMVGKALNDPIKGIAAMGRAGVQFSEDQKMMIKSLVETGKTAEAQRIILKELETQVGGSAQAMGQTFGGQIEITKNALLNIAESVGTKLLPALGLLVKAFSEMVGPIAIAFDSKPVALFFQYVQVLLVNFIAGLKTTFAIAESVIRAPFTIGVYIAALQTMGDFIIGFFGAMFNAIKKIASGGVQSLINYFKDYAKNTENEAEKLTAKLAQIEESRKKQINGIFAKKKSEEAAIHLETETNKTATTNEHSDGRVKKHQESEDAKNKITKDASDFRLKTVQDEFNLIVAAQTDHTEQILQLGNYQAQTQINTNNAMLDEILTVGSTANQIRNDNERKSADERKALEEDVYYNNKELIDILAAAEGDKNSKILDFVKNRIKQEIAVQAAAAIVKIGIYGLEYAIPTFGGSLIASGAGIAAVTALAAGAGAVVDEAIEGMKPKERESDKINRELDEEQKQREYAARKDEERQRRGLGNTITTQSQPSQMTTRVSGLSGQSSNFSTGSAAGGTINVNVMLDKQVLGRAIVDLRRQQEAGLL
jgi:hypothetical protein